MSKLVEKKVKDFHESYEEDLSSNQVFDSLSFYIYSLQIDKNYLYLLAKMLPDGVIQKLVAYYDGDYLRIPSKEEYYSAKVLAVCYYLNEVRQWSWDEIKDFLEVQDSEEFNPLALAKQITWVKTNLVRDLKESLMDYSEHQDNLREFLRGYVNGER